MSTSYEEFQNSASGNPTYANDYKSSSYNYEEARMMEEQSVEPSMVSTDSPKSPRNNRIDSPSNNAESQTTVQRANNRYDEYGEEDIDVEDNAGNATYNEAKFGDEEELLRSDYTHQVGAVNCCWRPNRPKSVKDVARRSCNWLALNKDQIFSGITVGVTQIPEVCSAALMAGINPIRALQSTWIINIVTSLVGGRPGMISGTTGFIALALIKLVEQHGVDYVFYAIMFAGVCQLAFGVMGLGALMRLIPDPLMIGFMNAMGLLLAAQQFRYAKVYPDQEYHSAPTDRHLIEVGHSWSHFIDNGSEWIRKSSFIVFIIEALVAFLVCAFLPKATKVVPSTFVAIVIASICEWAIVRQIGYESPLVEDYADVSSSFPRIVWNDPNIDMPSFNWDTFEKIWMAGLAVFAVSLFESQLTAIAVNELTGNNGMRNRIAVGQGFGNVISSVFGGMGGAGQIGQSVIANRAFGVTNLSTFLAGITLLVIVILASPAVQYIPLAAFAGVMFYVCFLGLIQWRSLLNGIAAIFPERIRDLIHLDCKIQRTDVLIMLIVTVVTLVFDLTVAVIAAVLVAVFVYAWDSSNRVVVDRELSEDGMNVTYNISGPLFFATAQSFLDLFPKEEIEHDPEDVILLLEGAELFDSSGMIALKKLHDRFEAIGKVAALSSLSPSSRRIMEKSAAMWEGVSFLEVEEIDEDELESIPSKIDTDEV